MAFGKKKPKADSGTWDCACKTNPAYLLFCPRCGQGKKS